MPSHSASKTLNAIVHNNSWTAHSGFAFLSAEIFVPNADVIPPFVGQSDRNRHDRTGMHFGEQSAATVLISDAVGSVPAGSSLDDVLRYLWNIVVDRESILGGRFTLDAELLEFLHFWKDSMARTVLVGMGTSSGPSEFGAFDWQRLDTDGGLDVDVTSIYVEHISDADGETSDFTGYPTISAGEFEASIYTFHVDTAEWYASWRPYRDDVAHVEVWFRRRLILGTWHMQAGIGDIIQSDMISDVSAEDFKAHFLLGGPGDDIAVKLWNWEDPEPPDYDFTATLPDLLAGSRWLAVGDSGKTSLSDDALTWALNTVGSDNYQDITYGPAFDVPTWMIVGSGVGVRWSRNASAWTVNSSANSPSGTLPNFSTCVTDGAGTWLAAAGATSPSTSIWRAIGDPATSFWNRQSTSLGHGVYRVRWLRDRFVAITQSGELATSPEGGTWTNRTTGMNTSEDWLDDAMYGNGMYLAHGGGGSGADEFKTLTSHDGSTWTLHTIAALTGYFPQAGAYGNGLFVVVGLTGVVAVSTDGVAWTVYDPGHTDDQRDLAYIDGTWVAVTSNGHVYETTDPTGTWTLQTSGFGSTNIASVFGRSDTPTGPTPTYHVEHVSGTPLFGLILNDFKAIKTDSDPARRYYNLRLDSWVGTAATTITQTFTADAIARARLAGSFLLDALAKAAKSSSKTLDAIVKAARSSSFTLDSEVSTSTSASFSLNAITLAHRAGSFILDALARATRSSSFTLDASTPTPIDGYDAGSGYNIGTYDGEGTPFYLDALIRHTFPASFTLDAGVAAPNDALYDSPTDTYTSSGKYDQPFFTLDAIVA